MRHTCSKEDVKALSTDIKVPTPIPGRACGQKIKGLTWPLGKDQSLCVRDQKALSTVTYAQYEMSRVFSDGLFFQ